MAAHLGTNISTIITGYGAGIIVAAFYVLAEEILPYIQPLWPNYAPLSTSIPLIGAVTQTVLEYIKTTAYYLFATILVNQATHHWHKNKLFFTLFFIASGFSLQLQSLDELPLWIALSVAIGLVMMFLYIHLIRYNNTLIPLMIAAVAVTDCIQQGIFNAYPGAWLAAVVNVCVIMGVSFVWFRKLNN